MRPTCSAALLLALTGAACVVGLDAPRAASGDAGAFADALSAGPDRTADDAHADDAGPEDIGPTDAAAADAVPADADPPDVTMLPDGGDPPDGGPRPPVEPCDALPEPMAGTCSVQRLSANAGVRHLRLAARGPDDLVVGFATATTLHVRQLHHMNGFDTPLVLLEALLPAGIGAADIAVATSDTAWMVVVAHERGVSCYRGEGAATSSSALDVGAVRAVALAYSTQFEGAAVTSDARLLMWSGDACPTVAATDAATTVRPYDVGLRVVGHDVRVALTSTVGPIQLALELGAPPTGALTWNATRAGVTDARVNTLAVGMSRTHAALTTRTATTPDRAVLELLFQRDAAASVARQRLTVASEVALARCGGGCAAMVHAPAHSPERLQIDYYDDDLRARGSGQRYRLACVPAPVAAVSAAGSGNAVLVGWADADGAFAMRCERP